MGERLAFTVHQLDEGVGVLTRCKSCGTFKLLDPTLLPPAALATPLRTLEAKVVCQWRGYAGRSAPCGGRVEFSIDGVRPGRSPLWDYDYGTP